MKLNKFLKTRFAPGIKAQTDGGIFPVKTVDFDEGVSECIRENGEVFRVHYSRVHEFLFGGNK